MAGAADAGTAWLDILPRFGSDFGRRLRAGIDPHVDGSAGHVESTLGGAFRKVAAIAAGAFAAVKVGEFFSGAIDGASDLSESVSKNRVVFGQASDEILKFAENSDTALGQSKAQALEATGVFGNLLRAVGLTEKDSAKLSTSMVQLASDLASFNNTGVDEALDALRSGLVGETEPLKRFGVNLNEATLKQKAMELGLSDGKGVLDANAKAQAAYAVIMEQTTLAQGDFARTSDGLANKQRIVAAQLDNAKAKLGAILLPIKLAAVNFGGKLIPQIEKFGQALEPAIGAAKQIFSVLLRRDFVSGGPFAEDSPLIDGVFRFRDTIVDLVGTVREAVDIIAAAFRGGDTAGLDGWRAGLAKVGEVARTVFDYLKANGKEVLMTLGVLVLATVVPAFVSWAAATIAATWPIVALAAAVFGAIKLLQRFPGIAKALGDAAGWVGEQLGGLVAWFKQAWPQIQEVVRHVVDAIVTIWHVWADDLLTVAKAVWAQVQNVVETAIDIIRNVIQLVMAIINGDWGKAWDAIKGIVRAAWDFIFETVENLGGVVAGLVGGLFDSAKRILGEALDGAVDFFRRLPGRILDALGNLGGLLIDAGVNLIEGLIKGIGSMAKRAADAAWDVVKGAVSKAWDAIVPGSPSKVGTAIGLNFGQGLVQGLERSAPLLDRAVPEVMAHMTHGFDPGVGAMLTAAQGVSPSGPVAIDYARLAAAMAKVSVRGDVVLDKRKVGTVMDAALESERRRLA